MKFPRRRTLCYLALLFSTIAIPTASMGATVFVAASLDPSGSYFDAGDFVAASPLLGSQLGFPDSVEAMFGDGELEVNSYYQPSDNHPAVRLRRMVVITYSGKLEANERVSHLQNSEFFSYVAAFVPQPVNYLSTPVNDPYFAWDLSDFNEHQHGIDQIWLRDAWMSGKGHTLLAAVDTGLDSDHEDLVDNFRRQISWGFFPGPIDDYEDDHETLKGHGTHVSGIAIASTNNGTGVVGACPNCSWAMKKSHVNNLGNVRAIKQLVEHGVTAINLSSGSHGPGSIACTSYGASGVDFCETLSLMVMRNVLLVAAAGNGPHDGRLDYPAYDAQVLGVGGSDYTGALWDEVNLLNPQCTLGTDGCGSNWGTGTGSGFIDNKTDILAPAARILSTLPFNYIEAPPLPDCSTNTFDPPGAPGNTNLYGGCTGTSMSTPFVTGIVGLIRSMNPWLSNDETRSAIRDTAMSIVNPNENTGEIDAHNAVLETLGVISGSTPINRLIPIVSLRSTDTDLDGDEDWLFTSSPQVSMTAIAGEMYHSPSGNYGTDDRVDYGPTGQTFLGLDYSDDAVVASPSGFFWAFGGHVPPTGTEPPGRELVPLYRLSTRDRSGVANCQTWKHTYATKLTGLGSVDYFTSLDPANSCPASTLQRGYNVVKIEGYIFENDGFPPSGAECLHRRYNTSSSKKSWALIPASELQNPIFQGYTHVPSGFDDCIGYVYPLSGTDADSDDLLDEWEVVMGTDPNLLDSDCDGQSDSDEYPIGGRPVSDPREGSPCPPDIDISWVQTGTHSTRVEVRNIGDLAATAVVVRLHVGSQDMWQGTVVGGMPANCVEVTDPTPLGFQSIVDCSFSTFAPTDLFELEYTVECGSGDIPFNAELHSVNPPEFNPINNSSSTVITLNGCLG